MRKTFVLLAALLSFCCHSWAQYDNDYEPIDAETLRQAMAGDVEAMHSVAFDYEHVRMDSAIYWYERASQEGYMFSQSRLGEIYEKYEPRNYEKAAHWYQKAAEQGYNWAQYRIGHFYRVGIGVTRDEKLAEEWLGKAARQGACWGYPQCEYAIYYAKGDEKKKLLQEAAEQRLLEGRVALAQLLESEGNNEEALRLYQDGSLIFNNVLPDTDKEEYDRLKQVCLDALDRLDK